MRRALLLRAILAMAPGRAAGSKTVIHLLMVDDQDKTAADLRRHHGFIALPDSPQTVRRSWQRSVGLRQQLQIGSNLPQSSYLISQSHIAQKPQRNMVAARPTPRVTSS